MRRMSKIAVAGLMALVFVSAFAGQCGGNDTAATQRDTAIESRAQAFSRAEHKFPVPKTENFPLREALVEFTERQDLIDHPWYVYILGMNGNAIGYYVARTVPINACNFLSSTEDVRDDSDGNLVLTAPSLDGIYYGGGGTSAGCDAWFFFDAATNALVQIRGTNFYAADQPLRIEAAAITVAPVAPKP
jgi:hypothetical protein